MATKQTSLRAAKQAKRKTRAKEKTKAAAIEIAKTKQLLGRRESEKTLMEMIAKDGPVAAAEYQHKFGKKKKSKTAGKPKDLTNKSVMENISHVIVAITKAHAGVSVFCSLADEKRFVITEEEQEIINDFDRIVVKITEDVDVISTHIEADQKPDDYMGIFVDYTHLVAQLYQDHFPIVVDMLKVHGPAMDLYYQEHRGGREVFDYMMQLHCKRMETVVPMYATKLTNHPAIDTSGLVQHNYTPDNPQPMDPVLELDQALLTVQPDVVKDVLGEPVPTPIA